LDFAVLAVGNAVPGVPGGERDLATPERHSAADRNQRWSSRFSVLARNTLKRELQQNRRAEQRF
jgi:hypothetical protein